MIKNKSLELRLLEKLVNFKKDDCWFWNGACSKKSNGRYPHIRDGDKTVLVASVILKLTKGEKPIGTEPLHLCHNTKCINPNHLKWGTHSENIKAQWFRRKNQII